MKLLVLVNMKSGLSDGAIFDYIRTFLEDADEVTIRATNGKTDIRIFLYDADKYDAVIVSGGDGTVCAVAHMLKDTGIPVLPFPAGTANLLSLNLLEPSEPHALVKMTREFNTMDFDLGEIEFPDGKKIGFSLIAGAGYDAKIMQDAKSGKAALGQMAYFTSAFTNFNPQVSDFKLTIDGREIHSRGIGVLIINFSKMQFDISVVHENLPRDGMFDIVVLHTKDALGLLPAVFAAIRDRDGENPSRSGAVEVFRGSEVYVEADPPMRMQFDGEPSEHSTPFKAHILHNAARYLVSDECIKTYAE